ncbi:MAG: type II toxin-antitoxin system mRNA interferase toxin, RelE/StbE family [Candidatus Peregrinibacteria bacterium]|nr:type II toxin-antitoxin system mRNA interferase toxin, RelE/StbE family [Candidatus Peregrinibacteria bacterium]
MKIRFHKNFEKHYKKLQKEDKAKVLAAISKFSENPLDPTLKNHPLHGSIKGKRSFSAANDLRIIFEEFDDYVLVIMLDVGSHNQIY